MFDKENYKDDVYKKIREIKNLQDFDQKFDFSEKNNFTQYRFLKIVATVILGISITISGVFATNEIYNKYISQYIKPNNYKEYTIEMSTCSNDSNVMYKKIDNYSEYIEIKKNYSDLLEMTESEFQTEFLLVIRLLGGMQNGLNVRDITTNENSININLYKGSIDSNIIDRNELFIKLSREENKDNVIVNIIPGVNDITKYTPMEKITESYCDNQAITENCIIIKEEKLISNNKELLDDFVTNTQLEREEQLRIVRIGKYDDNTKFVIQDVIYKNGEYYVNNLNYGSNEQPNSTYIYAGSKINVYEAGSYIIYGFIKDNQETTSVSFYKE